LKSDYEYQRIYGGIGDTPSHSTASEAYLSSFNNDSNREERVVVIAPAGSLGVVIGTPTGFPAVHAIKDTSVIIDQIQIGDKLISVDGQNTTKMSAIKVSSLIGSKAMNPQRILVFARPLSKSGVVG
jgi:C-terminal processing protease CtpA/Prc